MNETSYLGPLRLGLAVLLPVLLPLRLPLLLPLADWVVGLPSLEAVSLAGAPPTAPSSVVL